MGTTSAVYLPDGQHPWLPVAPRTWVDEGPATVGDSLRAPLLNLDAAGGAVWHRQRPLFHGIATLAQSIPASTWTSVTGLAELIDNWSGHSDSTNTGRYYAPSTATGADWYLCTGLVPFSTSSSTDAHIAGLRVNSATNYEGMRLPGGAGHVMTTAVIDLIQLDGGAGDYVELGAWHNEAAAVNTVVSSKLPSLQVRWVCQNPAGAATPALPAIPHTWTGADIVTASATGANKVPLNTELRDTFRFLNNPPIFRVHCSGTAQTIPAGAGTWTAFTFTGESVDNYGMWSSGASVTCQRAGLYYVAGLAAVTEPATKNGYRASRIHHTIAAGGSADYYGISALPMTGTKTTGTSLIADAWIRMAVGDTLQLQMDQTQTTAPTALPVLGTSAAVSARMVGLWAAR
jgi:hypothetical protein